MILQRWGQRIRWPQPLVSYRDGGEAGGLDLKESREIRSIVMLPVSLASMACGFPGNAWWS